MGLIFLGALLLLVGAVALFFPVRTSIGLGWLLGFALIASGVAQGIYAVRTRKEKGRFGRFFLALLSLVCGGLVAMNPAIGMIGITLSMTFYFFMSAVAKWTLAAEMRPQKSWGWVFASSLISFAAGIYLMFTLPASALIAPGIFFGVDLIFFGVTCIAMARAVRRVEKSVVEVLPPRREEEERPSRGAA